MSQKSEIGRLIHEILNALEGTSGIPLTSVVRKAVRLAALCDEPEYRLLFQHHIDGFLMKGAVRSSVQKWGDKSQQPKWDIKKAYAEDRAVDSETTQDLPLEQLEQLLTEAKVNRQNRAALEAYKDELVVARVLNRITARMARFVADIQKQSMEPEGRIMPQELDQARGIPKAIILTALPVEYRAVRVHLTDLQEEIHPQGTVYEKGKFSSAIHSWEVGIVEIGEGNPAAAMEAE
jgi:hypothetical protein